MPIVTFQSVTGRTGRVDVPQHVADEWARLCYATSRLTPVNSFGFRLRPYPEMNVARHRPYARAGIYVDHQDPTVERLAYAQRDRVEATRNGERQAVLQGLADQYEMRHWRDMYNLIRNVGRRETGESGRDASGELRWRAWNGRAWSRSGIAATAGSAFRRFGIEIEFNHNGYNGLSQDRAAIVADARAAGIHGTQRWGSHYRDTGIAGWQYMYDCTVSGGEIVSDVLDGSAAAHEEVRVMLAAVRSNGGIPGREQGMHVHHDCSDFTQADKLRLLDNLQAAQDAIVAFVPSGRRHANQWCRLAGDYEWQQARSCVASGRSVTIGRYFAFNLSHMMLAGGQARVEWRALGHTLNGRKVRAWIRLGQAVMQATKAGEVFDQDITPPALAAILRQHGLTQWAADQYLARTGNLVAA